MVGIVGCEVMRAGEVFFGAHIDVIMLGMVQHSIQTDRRGDADGAGGQAGIAVGVVGRVDGEVIIGDFHFSTISGKHLENLENTK